ncbi:hypothetical protein BJ508DRAFT_193112, partial [Ascobolus immersus RN42]
IKNYRTKIQNFLNLLFVVIHLASGQPARGTEISGLQYRNLVSGQRALMIIDNCLCFVLKYNKSQS